MRDVIYFKNELELIQNTANRDMVARFLEGATPDYFWEIPASTTGKYHPEFAQGKQGLLRHTKASIMVAKELLQIENYNSAGFNRDAVVAALLIHDSFKCGEQGIYTNPNHGFIAAEKWSAFVTLHGCEKSDFFRCVTACVLWHMGQWSGKRVKECTYGTDEWKEEIQFVQLCDYIASRKFVKTYEQE